MQDKLVTSLENLIAIITFCVHSVCSVMNPCLLLCIIKHLHVYHYLSKDGWTPFHAACHEGHVQVAELLLQAGASLEKETEVTWDQIV